MSMLGKVGGTISWLRKNAGVVATTGMVVTAVTVMSIVSLLGEDQEECEAMEHMEHSVSWSDDHGQPLVAVMT